MKRKFWYKQFVGGCPVCGRDAGYKERVYGKKPKKLNKIYIQLSDFETYDYCIN